MGSVSPERMMANPSFVMKAIKQVNIEDRPIPKLNDPYDVLVHVSHTGICGSDVHYWQRGRIGEYVVKDPMVLGHESSGVVAAVGPSVTSLKPGDRVAMEPGVPCRRCQFCRRGNYHLCDLMVFAATPPYDGTLAKYYVNAADFCYKVPDSISLEEAAMVEPLAVACAVCTTASLKGGQSVLVLGCGVIGVLCSAVARQWGATRVIGVDIAPSRLEVARSYGQDSSFTPKRAPEGVDPHLHMESEAERLKETFGVRDGFDVILECSGAEPCVQLGIFAAKKGGTFVQAGMGKEVISFPITTLITRGLNMKGSIRYQPGSYEAAIALIVGGKVDVKRLITNRFKFEQAEEAFELVKAAKPAVFKVIIEGVQ